jgi:hypothetical protein
MKQPRMLFLAIFLIGFVQYTTAQPYWYKDHEEPAASGVSIPVILTPVQQQNLNILCRVWGVVKYFHPRLANGEHNADKALFAIMPQALHKSGNSFQRELCKWIDALGYVPALPDDPVPENTFRLTSMVWMQQQPVGYELGKRLQFIVQNNYREGDGYYMHQMKIGSNPDLTNEFQYKNVKGEDGGMRMLALFRYWNAIEYLYPSKYLTADNWDTVLLKFIPRFAAANTDKAYRMLCVELAVTIHDTHANNVTADSVFTETIGAYTVPMWLADIQDSMVFSFYMYDSLRNNYPIKPGDRLIAVNGKNVLEIMDSVKRFTTASNRSSFMHHTLNRVKRSKQPDNIYTIIRGMDTMHLQIHNMSVLNPPRNARNHISAQYPMYRMIGDDIGYINIGKARLDSLALIFKTFAGTRGLVIDQRNYPVEHVPYAMGEYMKPQASPFVKFSRVDYTRPGRFLMGEEIETGSYNPNYYKGKVVILVYPQTQSQAEFIAMALRTSPNAIIMGSQTSGADGNVSNIFFPGGIASYMSGLGTYYPDGTPAQGIGIVPDIVVKPTIAGLRRGEDELLDAAIKYIRESPPKKN